MWDFGEEPGDGVGGPVVSDAGTICGCFTDEDGPLIPDDYDWENETPIKTSLSEMVDDFLDGARSPDGRLDREHVRSAIKLRDALLCAAIKIEAALPRE